MNEAVYKLADLPLMLVDGDAARLSNIKNIGIHDFFLLLNKKLIAASNAGRNNKFPSAGNRGAGGYG